MNCRIVTAPSTRVGTVDVNFADGCRDDTGVGFKRGSDGGFDRIRVGFDEPLNAGYMVGGKDGAELVIADGSMVGDSDGTAVETEDGTSEGEYEIGTRIGNKDEVTVATADGELEGFAARPLLSGLDDGI